MVMVPSSVPLPTAIMVVPSAVVAVDWPEHAPRGRCAHPILLCQSGCVDLADSSIAQRLGVSRQRFQQLARYPTFPKPYQELRGMKVWLAEDIEAWIKEHRQPRPTDED